MAEELQSARQVVGERVRERREAAGLTQAELAQRVYVSRQTVNNWETGKTLIDVQSLALVADELETSASELLGEHGTSAVRAEAESRHGLVRLLLRAALAYAVFFVSTMVFLYASWLLDWDTSVGRGTVSPDVVPSPVRLLLERCLRRTRHPVHARARFC